MGTQESANAAVKKPTLTPKAVIHQKFGSKAVYQIEEVLEPIDDGCPGLAVAQKHRCLFRCHLKLPDFSVESGTFKRKKDAEQSAAEMALLKLDIDINDNESSMLDATEALVARLSFLFSEEFLSSSHPLSSHMKVALQREGKLSGLVPSSILLALDAKLCSLCKSINPLVETYPFLALPLISRAASTLSDFFLMSEDLSWLRRVNPYAVQITESVSVTRPDKDKSKWVEVTFIPSLPDAPVQSLSLDLYSKGYYLDVIAKALSTADASMVLMSRTMGKASSEMRVYFSASEKHNLICQSTKDSFDVVGPFNARASFICGQGIYGDAILASIGYTWKSADLFHEDVSLRTYYRTLIGRAPGGLYKLSREAPLTAELPVDFTCRANWRGLLPRDLLCTFCRQHRLGEPVFSVASNDFELDSVKSCKKFKTDIDGAVDEMVELVKADNMVRSERSFRCELRLFSKSQDLILEYVLKKLSKNKNDSVQNAALIVLSWLNMYFEHLDISSEKLAAFGDSFHIQCHTAQFLKEFYVCQLIYNLQKQQTGSCGQRLLFDNPLNQQKGISECGVDHFNMEGPNSGLSPSSGYMVSICYSVSLVTVGKLEEYVVECSDELEFEMGTGAVIPKIEELLQQMVVGQTVFFNKELPQWEFILSAASDSLKTLSVLSMQDCFLKYTIVLLKVSEPLEDRMEQALFSPPLSKQRVTFALHHIKESTAKSLIDFGCGSGSLLDALTDYPNSLETIVGVDISQKGLIRAAKVMHSKLTKSDDKQSLAGLKSLILYDGSITTFDPRLYGFDIGTCLEVIEHMEEEQASLFGDIALRSFRPRILIVSTPNYEYNVILQKSNLSKQEETEEEKSASSSRFRNHDHKFEWTREQFGQWASDLAKRHKYSVEFGGVGGSADVEPGFASQIAVFKRGSDHSGEELNAEPSSYEVMWEWNAANLVHPPSAA